MARIRSKLSFLFMLYCLLFAAGSAARTYDDIIESGYLTFAVYENFPPYSFQQEGQPQGVDIDVARHIAGALGVEARWLWINADENLEDDLRNAIWKGHIITKKKADVMMRVPYDRRFNYAIDGYGQAKNELVVMFAPYHREKWAILRDHAKTNTIRTLAIFQYEPIAVEIDSLPSFFLGSTLGGRLRSHLVHVPSTFDGITKLKHSEVAAVTGLHSQLEWGMRPLTEQYDISADGLAALSIKAWDIGMAVKHDNRQLAYAIEAVIEPMVQSDKLASIFDSYHLSYFTPDLYSDQTN